MDGEPSQANPRGGDVHLRSGPQMQEYVTIADRIASEQPGRLLDWGCGFGQMTELLIERRVDVAAFDYDGDLESDGEYPLESYPGRTAYLSSNPVQLPYADGEFDSVLSCGVLEHVLDPLGSLAEVRRVLKPGGRFYVYKLPYRYSYLERIAKRAGHYYHGAHATDRIYSQNEAVTLLEVSGFEVEDVRRSNMLPLTIPNQFMRTHARSIWRVNVALAQVPGLNLLATNVELTATKPVGQA